MLLDCSRCGALVDAPVLYTYDDEDDGHEEPPGRWHFAKCPKCKLPLLAVQLDSGSGFEDDSPVRVYPPLERQLGFAVPEAIRSAFGEAGNCYRVKAFTASALMCRKALEGLCRAHGMDEGNLSKNIKKLRDSGVIDSKLFEWAEALRTLGNEAAHGVGLTVSKREANDVLDFTEALCEYVFTYRVKFEQFQARIASKAVQAGKATKPGKDEF